MYDWIIDQVKHLNLLTLLISIGGSWFLQAIFDWIKRRNLQKQQASIEESLQQLKAKIDCDLEATKVRYQKEIQAHYFETQLQVKTLFEAYPDLHLALKETEGLVYQTVYHSIAFKDEAHRSWCSLTQKLSKHSLFLDDDLRTKCIAAKDVLILAIQTCSNMDEKAKDALITDIHQKTDSVSNLMRSRLMEQEEDPKFMNTLSKDF
jgi:hypothetical protein